MTHRSHAEIAAELATFREFCTCTENEEDPQCDGTRCMGQQRTIEAALQDAFDLGFRAAGGEIFPLVHALGEIADAAKEDK